MGKRPRTFDERTTPSEGAIERTPVANGDPLEQCRLYLLHLANQEVPSELLPKDAASDMVQQTFLEAHQALPKFRGQSEEELRAWLRQILLRNVANLVRSFYGTEMRQIGREMDLRSLSPDLADPSGPHSETPSQLASKEEELQRLEQAVERLPAQYREVIRLRQHEKLTFAQVGKRMDRSEEAVRKLWNRSIKRLRMDLQIADGRGG